MGESRAIWQLKLNSCALSTRLCGHGDGNTSIKPVEDRVGSVFLRGKQALKPCVLA